MPPIVIGTTHIEKIDASNWEKENANMKYKFQVKFADKANPRNPHHKCLPQAFLWDPNTNYTLKNGQAKVYDPKQQKLISNYPQDPEEEPQDLSTFKLTYMTTAEASPNKKQKTDHNDQTNV